MEVWIDIARIGDAHGLFGIPPLERHMRTLARLKPAPERIVLSGRRAAIMNIVTGAPDILDESDPLPARLARYLRDEARGDVLVIDGAGLVDPRLPAFLNQPGPPLAAGSGEGDARGAVLRLRPEDAAHIPEGSETVLALADALREAGNIEELRQEDFPGFIAHLRRTNPFHVTSITSQDQARSLERQLFKANYKGSTDFLTKWIYPPVVWPLVRLSIQYGIHPNTITLIGIACTIAAVPLFAAGAFGLGLIFAYAMSVLDSVDGKVARLTQTDSAIGNVLDHGLDIIHPPFWYLAWAWGMTGGDTAAPVFIAAIAMTGFYIADRLVLMAAKARFRRGLHAVTALDGAVRTVIARRNTLLVLLTAGHLLGFMDVAFYAVAAWQGLTMAWHGWRTAILWNNAQR